MLKIGRASQELFAWCLLIGLVVASNASDKRDKASSPSKSQPKAQAKHVPDKAAKHAPGPANKGKQHKTTIKESADKGKHGKATSLQVAKTASGKTAAKDKSGKATSLNKAARNTREPEPKAKAKTKDSAVLAKAVGKSANRGDEKVLTSRLLRASFAPKQTEEESERHGKFGKAAPRSTREVEAEPFTALKNMRPREVQPERTSARSSEQDDDRAETNAVRRTAEASALSTKASKSANAANAEEDTPAYQIQLPDKIEVSEAGSLSPTMTNLLTLSNSRPSTPFGAVVTKNNTPPALRNDLAIPSERVQEIQYELAKRGFYNGPLNGVYDEATLLAMWEFQKNYGLPATGYPTAHALKRLGLTSW